MKLKVKSGRHGTKMTGESGANEEFIYTEAECVRSGCSETLLTFSYEQKKKGYTFDYYAGTARPVGEVLSDLLSREYYESMLISFLHLAQACDDNGLSVQRISFEPETILFDPALYALRFAYMPVRGNTGHIVSPLQVIEYISDHAQFADDETQQLADRVLDYARRSSIFSWIEYESFLREAGVLEGQSSGADRGTSMLDGRQTSRIDCRDTYGFDFISQSSKAASEVQTPPPQPEQLVSRRPRFVLVRPFDGSKWEIPEGVSFLGSLPECEICISDTNGISRRHAKFVVVGGSCSIIDNESTNGTSVNGKRIAPNTSVPLNPNDKIQIARMQFELKDMQQ